MSPVVHSDSQYKVMFWLEDADEKHKRIFASRRKENKKS